MHFLELRVPPVAQLVIFAALMWTISAALPLLHFSIPGALWIGVFVAAAGSVVALLGVIEFRKAQTTVDPRVPEKTASLVVSGVYRISRNPMYAGLLLVLAGWACYLSHVLAFLLLPGFVAYMNRFQIAPEESYMVQKFGDAFREYSTRVRRWI